jgi:hypothetical protein
VDRVSPSQQGEYRGSVPAEGPSYQPSPRIRLLSCSLRCNSERGIVRKGASCVSPCFATSGALFRVAMPGGGAREWSTPGGCSDTRARRWPKSLAGGRGHVGKPTAARGTAGEGEAARSPHWVFVEACTAVTDMPRRCGRARRREWVREPKPASHASLLTLLGAMSVHTPAERTLEGTSASTSIARCFALAEASPYSRTIAARGCFPLS